MSSEYDDLARLLDEQELVAQAKVRYSQTEGYQAQLKSLYTRLLHFYNPLNGDQWPEDTVQRPGKIHMTVNIVKPAVDIDARLQAILPRLALVPDASDAETQKAAEAAETLMIRFLELSGWDVWLSEFTQVRSLYGKSVLKPIWNKADKRPDVVVVENPANLRIGWGSSDYRVKDWAIYEYALSPLEAMIQFPNIIITNPKKGPQHQLSVARSADHTDPLQQKLPATAAESAAGKLLARPVPFQPSDYEDKQVSVWDYWYKRPDGSVWNCIIVGGVLATGPTPHPEYPDIPYIVAENDHVPGNPEGVSTAYPILDIQIELNRALSHFAQLVADEVDPAFQINADAVPAGVVAKGGEISAVGEEHEIKPIPKGVNQFPIQQLIDTFWAHFHRETGMSEIVFGQVPSSDVSGRALAVQVEAVINRLDLRRRRLYAALRDLILFWGYMTKKINPQITVTDPQGQKQQVGVAEVLGDYNRWRIIAPEITPRDVLDNTTNVLNKLSGKVISLATAMDELGVDSPEREMDLIRRDRSDAHLFPGDVLNYVAVVNGINTLQQQMAQANQTIQQMQGQAQGAQQAQDQAAQPQGFPGDNGSSPPQPATAAGGPPPAGGQGPLATTSLIRPQPNGNAVALNQLALKGRL